jgi:hypothetical protein
MWGRSDARYQGDVTPVAFYPASPWKALMSLARWRPSPRSIATLLAWRQRLKERRTRAAHDARQPRGGPSQPGGEQESGAESAAGGESLVLAPSRPEGSAAAGIRRGTAPKAAGKV